MTRRAQRGAALIILLAIIVLAVSWLLVSSAGTALNTQAAASREHNAQVLNLAKQALVGYVAHRVNYPAAPLASREPHPGRLPCPEAPGNIGTANEGVAASFCSLPAVGRLPWKTLGIDPLRDAANELLWYVVSPGWTLPFSTATLALNSSTRGELSLDSQANAAAALLIAPGAPLAVQDSAQCTARAQTRAVPSASMDFRDYLECQNATSPPDAAFATAGPSGSFNDQVLAVSAIDLWSVVEGAVASRIERDVLPALASAFGAPYTDSTQWGTGVAGATPMLPFALSFADDSMLPFQGTLPLWRGQACTAGSDPLCDPGFVHWETADPDPLLNPRVVKRSGSANITSSNCSLSSGNEVVCTVTYANWCGGGLGYLLGGRCYLTMRASVLANARNVGRALRSFDPAPISGFASLVSHPSPIDSTATASADIRGDLAEPSCATIIILGVLFPCYASETVTLRIPIAVFADHPALTALFATGTDWEWFVENAWYEAMYYAVAPSHAPGGSPHDCAAAGDCLTVSNGTLAGDVRALMGMTGYSMSGLARPTTNFADYLDSGANTDGDTAFEQKTAGRSFNDRFFAISAY